MHWENGLTQHTPETVRLHKQPRQMTECSCIRRRAQLDAEFNNFIFSNSKPGGGGSVGSHHKTDRLRFRKFYLDKQPRQMTERTCNRRRAQLDAEFNNFIFSNSKPGGGGSVGSHHKTDRLRFRKFYLDKHPRQMTERIYIEDELCWYIP